MPAQPIAIVGRACLLPGAHSPEELWDNVVNGRDCVTSAPEGRWRLDHRGVMTDDPEHASDRTWSDRGGYVTGFEQVFDPSGFGMPEDSVKLLDPLFQWTLHTVRAALRDAKLSGNERTGLVMGNLSFPAGEMARFAEQTWLPPELAEKLGATGVAPHNRFMSGLPAHLAASALGLGAGAFALDAACASSLYAIRLAAEALYDGRADVMVAGAVNRCDDLFIHVGFCALKAMSKTGQSRPFHAQADGLVPAEGAAFLTLMRLADAEAQGLPIHGVLRGIGLSNDGRGRGLLAPSTAGQVRAIADAYARSGLTPADVQLLECHATGTVVGDKTELGSIGQVYAGRTDVPIGSLKSNLGHLITAAGAAGVIKVLEAMRHQQMPPTLHVEDPTPHLEGSPFRLLTHAEPWQSDGPRRAAVSAFGFGGNNAHCVVEEYVPGALSAARPPLATGRLAIVGLGAVVAGADSAHALHRDLLTARSHVVDGEARTQTVKLSVKGLKTPPKDLEQTLGQQTAMQAAAAEALAMAEVSGPRAAVLIGMQADEEVARYGLRWRLDAAGADDAAKDGVIAYLRSPGVLGTMPNIPANRLNMQFDLGGPSYSVSAEELSGIRALEVASRALREHELDAALVGAVDLSCEPVHRAAIAQLLGELPAGDAAVALVLMREEDARAQGKALLAVLPDQPGEPQLRLALQGGQSPLTGLFGHAHAASGLLHVVAAALTLHAPARPDGQPWQGVRTAQVAVAALGNQTAFVHLECPEPREVPVPPYTPSEPVLSLPAHQAPVSVPADALGASGGLSELDAVAVAPVVGGKQVMAAAPTLASVMQTEPSAVSDQQSTVVATPPQPVAAPVPAPEAAPMPAPVAMPAMPQLPAGHPLAAVMARAAQEHQRVAQNHLQFLQQQVAMQQQFLNLRTATTQALLNARGRTPVTTHLASFAPAAAAPAPVARPVPAAPVAPAPAAAPAPAPTAPAAPVARPAAPAPAPVVTETVSGGIARTLPPSDNRTSKGRGPFFRTPDYALPPEVLPGPKWNRQQLEFQSEGTLSALYGEVFTGQDGHPIQCRMPQPPLLLCDRVTGIDADPGSMGLGTIWTETDVRDDAWYSHVGRMPAGVLIESGQADLILISWLGIDLLHPGDRMYRLLGCELTYHRSLPGNGETLQYDIHVDGHAKHGDTRLFFFHYDCRIAGEKMLTVRHGQAGFFTKEELDDSDGILWRPEDQEIVAEPRLDAPVAPANKTHLTRAELEAFAAGDIPACFGPGFEYTEPHTRTPRIAGGQMLFLEEVTHLERDGGPWGRGYLRAIDHITPEDWFFQGHFFNDPCMPGTLMFEGCLQAMAVYMASLGFTIDKDGWRFEPLPGETFKLLCRGQVIPTSKLLVYEVFVEEVVSGPEPIVYADLLCTVDGLGAFHCRRMALRLTADFALTTKPHLLEGYVEPEPCATADFFGDHPATTKWREDAQKRGIDFGEKTGPFTFDYKSLLACAWGKPSEAFGPMYRPFDGHRKVARLPGLPYHFMSRVTVIDGPIGAFQPGARVVLEYDIPADEWYFHDNTNATMPFAVLLEAALQPCGWLASFVGSALSVNDDLMFRNLDGTGTLLRELRPGDTTLRTEVTITKVSASAGMIIEGFDVMCTIDGEPVYDLETVFGFFPPEAFVNQVGIPGTPLQTELCNEAAGEVIDLTQRAAPWFGGELELPTGTMLMIDRVDAIHPEGGTHGKGAYRAQKDVEPSEWFFKAHFYDDPVQPGSLGLEALLQLQMFAMMDRNQHEGIEAPRFEPLELGRPMTWKYRGQVVPKNKLITSLIEVVEQGTDERGPYMVIDGSLFVDGKRIYETKNQGMRIVSGGHITPKPLGTVFRKGAGEVVPPPAPVATLDPSVDTWLLDHCPTWTAPAAPMTWILDQLARAAAQRWPAWQLRELREVQILRWLDVPETRELRTKLTETGHGTGRVVLEVLVDGDWQTLAFGTVQHAEGWQNPPPPSLPPCKPSDAPADPNPYQTGTLFHGPAFQVATSLHSVPGAATVRLDADPASVPVGLLNPRLLDGGTHGIPHDRLNTWAERFDAGNVAYPSRVKSFRVFGPTPTSGEVRCEVRLLDAKAPTFRLLYIHRDQVWAELVLEEMAFPKGPLGGAEPSSRRDFLRDGKPSGVSLGTTEGDKTTVKFADVKASNWFPGTLQAVYGVDAVETDDLAAAIALGEGVGHAADAHPRTVVSDGVNAVSARLPLTRFPVAVKTQKTQATCVVGEPAFDLSPVRQYWSEWFGVGRWPVEDLYYGLCERFVGKVVIDDPEAFEAVRGRSMLYLANHQVMLESLLFSVLASGLTGVPTVTLAKEEHRVSWLGQLIAHCFAYPGVKDPEVIEFFNREDKSSLPRIIGKLAQQMMGPGKSVMVHVEGTRSKSCRLPVEKMTGKFIDMAIEVGAPIVPVRLVGGLPAEPLDERIDFPLGHGTQDYWLGRPILPEELQGMPYGERKKVVLAAINGLGPSAAKEQPSPPDPGFDARVHEWMKQTGASPAHAALMQTLVLLDEPEAEIGKLLAGAQAGHFQPEDTEKGAWLAELARRLFGPKGPKVG